MNCKPLIYGDYIYYIKTPYTVDKGYEKKGKSEGCYRILCDGSNPERILEGDVSLVGIDGSNLFVTKFENNNFNLYKGEVGSNKLKLLIKGGVGYFVNNGWIYYTKNTSGYNYYIFKMKTDGTNNIKLKNKSTRIKSVNNGKIYFSEIIHVVKGKLLSSDRLQRMDTDGKNRADLISDHAELAFSDSDVFYYCSDAKSNTVRTFSFSKFDVGLLQGKGSDVKVLYTTKNVVFSIAAYSMPPKQSNSSINNKE